MPGVQTNASPVTRNEVERSEHIEDGLDQGSRRSGPFADLRWGLRGGELVENSAFEGTRERGEGPHGRAQIEDPLAFRSARQTDFRCVCPTGGLNPGDRRFAS